MAPSKKTEFSSTASMGSTRRSQRKITIDSEPSEKVSTPKKRSNNLAYLTPQSLKRKRKEESIDGDDENEDDNVSTVEVISPSPKVKSSKGKGRKLELASPIRIKKPRFTVDSNSEKDDDERSDVSKEHSVYLEDVEPRTIVPELTSCEVYDANLADDGLADTYDGLPNLPGGKRMLCRNSEVLNGYACISLVAEELGCDFQYLKKLITYSGSATKNVVNLSRIDPALLLLSPPSGKWKTQYIVYKNKQKPALCFTIGLAVNDSTRTPFSFIGKSEKLYQKSISIVPITLEIERHVSTLCTILNVDEYWSQFDDNALRFVTVPGNMKDKGKSSSSTPYPKKINNHFYKKTVTKAAVGTSLKPSTSMYSSSALSVNDEVRVVDAQEDEFILPKDLYNVERFKPFRRTIPYESIVMVIYTTSKWGTDDRLDEANISHHVHSVVVLKAAGKET